MVLHALLLPPPRPKRLLTRWHILPDDMSICLDGENEADAATFAADRQQHYYWFQELPAPVRATAADLTTLPPPLLMLRTAAAVGFYLLPSFSRAWKMEMTLLMSRLCRVSSITQPRRSALSLPSFCLLHPNLQSKDLTTRQ